MGYEGARLAPLFTPEPSRRAARSIAKRGAEELHRLTVQNTPIDDSPYPSRAPGTARRSWATLRPGRHVRSARPAQVVQAVTQNQRDRNS